jgi:hypothetical protein
VSIRLKKFRWYGLNHASAKKLVSNFYYLRNNVKKYLVALKFFSNLIITKILSAVEACKDKGQVH